MYYDIRTPVNARHTLEELTGIPFSLWEKEEEENKNLTQHIQQVLHKYNGVLLPYREYQFVFSHLTSSAEGCKSIYNYGLMDLTRTYDNKQSELRRFLDDNGIALHLDVAILEYAGKPYDISYRSSSLFYSDAENTAIRIGYRFYRDKRVCGFLSIDSTIPYPTRVDQQPEILVDISTLINKDIAGEWKSAHKSYEITAIVDSTDVVLEGEKGATEVEIAMAYAELAYWNCFETDSRILQCKDGVQIPRERIICIQPFGDWK